MKSVRIGTRGSNLALIQANKVRSAIVAVYPDIRVDIQTISTTGDKDTVEPLHTVQTTGVFVKELEQALIADHIDIAVHSLKDMPTELPPELSITAVLERDDPRDALLRADGRFGDLLAAGETVGTSSLRRKAQLLRLFPDIRIVDIRGNIETRLAKMDGGLCVATILAACGIDRANYGERISHRFSMDEMLPAACQGIIAVEQRTKHVRVTRLLELINHPETLILAQTERTFLRAVEGGCRVPVGCLSRIADGEITITGLVAMEDGSAEVRRSMTGPVGGSKELAAQLASTVLADGGKEILLSYDSRR